jgi:hypothetical protein
MAADAPTTARAHTFETPAHCGTCMLLHTSAMKPFALAVFLVLAGVAPTRAQWTLAPTFSFGYGWSDGQYDYVGDEPPLQSWYCEVGWMFQTVQAANPPPPTRPSYCDRRKTIAPVTPYGALGLTLVGGLSSRFALAFSLDLTFGSTHRIGRASPSGGDLFFYDGGRDWFYARTFELAHRVASTARVKLGRVRRGYLGTGLRLGYRRQFGRMDERAGAIDPDASPIPENWHFPQGFTAEALLEGGVVLGRTRAATLGVVVGAGRPRFRVEVVMSFPFAIAVRER